MSRQPIPIAERLGRLSIPEPNSGCVLWLGSINPSTGYGTLANGHGGYQYAHRAAYEAYIGPIPSGFQIDHLCRNRACVAPWHLEAVTQKVNLLRGVGFAGINARKTHCHRGHPFDEANTRWRSNRTGRECITCKSEWGIRRRDRRRALRAQQKADLALPVMNDLTERAAS